MLGGPLTTTQVVLGGRLVVTWVVLGVYLWQHMWSGGTACRGDHQLHDRTISTSSSMETYWQEKWCGHGRRGLLCDWVLLAALNSLHTDTFSKHNCSTHTCRKFKRKFTNKDNISTFHSSMYYGILCMAIALWLSSMIITGTPRSDNSLLNRTDSWVAEKFSVWHFLVIFFQYYNMI